MFVHDFFHVYFFSNFDVAVVVVGIHASSIISYKFN